MQQGYEKITLGEYFKPGDLCSATSSFWAYRTFEDATKDTAPLEKPIDIKKDDILLFVDAEQQVSHTFKSEESLTINYVTKWLYEERLVYLRFIFKGTFREYHSHNLKRELANSLNFFVRNMCRDPENRELIRNKQEYDRMLTG